MLRFGSNLGKLQKLGNLPLRPIYSGIVIASRDVFAQRLAISECQHDATKRRAFCLQCTPSAIRRLLLETPNIVQRRCETGMIALYLKEHSRHFY